MGNINNANKSRAPNKKIIMYDIIAVKISREHFPSREAIDIIIFIIMLYYYGYKCNMYNNLYMYYKTFF